jgi:hypothetical protein
MLRADGRLKASAPANAKRGEKLFFKAGTKGGKQACATCHIPARGFTDGKRHDVGTGGAVVTPSLLGSARGPYLHDARNDFLGPAVGHFTQRFGIGNDAKEFADLIAYLRVVGAAGNDRVRVTLARDLGDIVAGEGVIDGLLAQRDNGALGLVVATLRRDLGRVHDRFPDASHAAARRALVAWSRGLQGVRAAAEAGDHVRARALLVTLRKNRAGWRTALEAAAETSLYDPARLDAFLAKKTKAP